MSVRVKDRKMEKKVFQVNLKARKLATHTRMIVQNDNIFKPEYDATGELRKRLIDTSLNIFLYCWRANNIRVTSSYNYWKRHNYQQNALDLCVDMLALIDLAYRQFHLRYKKVAYWFRITIEVKKMIYVWFQNDRKRYSSYRK